MNHRNKVNDALYAALSECVRLLADYEDTKGEEGKAYRWPESSFTLGTAAGRTEDDPMTEFIGQITVFIEACDKTAAEQRLRQLAQQLEDGEPDIPFADHNGDLQDAAEVEAECEASLTPTPPPFRPFDGYEIHGVREFDTDSEPYCEQVPDSEAEFWSLYGHIPGHGLECIGDFRTRQLAEEIQARITGRRTTQSRR